MFLPEYMRISPPKEYSSQTAESFYGNGPEQGIPGLREAHTTELSHIPAARNTYGTVRSRALLSGVGCVDAALFTGIAICTV